MIPGPSGRGPAFAILALLAVVLAPVCVAAEDAPRQQGVLVVYSDSRIQPATLAFDQALRAQLPAVPPERLAYYNEYLDMVRFPSAEEQEGFAAYLTNKYRNHPIDVVVCAREAALDFMVTHRATIAPGAALLHIGVERAGIERRALPADTAGFPTDIDAGAVVGLARRLHPHARTFAIACGVGDLDKQWERAFRREMEGTRDEVRWLVDRSLEQMEREVSILPADSVLLIGVIGRDTSGRTLIPVDAVRSLVRASNAPAYVTYNTMVGEGAVGGAVFDIPGWGLAAGDAVTRLLAGAHTADLRLADLRPDHLLIDWRQLDRWRIPHDAVPSTAQVLFREPGFWERNHLWILVAAGVIVVQATLIAALSVQRRRLRRAHTQLLDGEQRMAMAAGAAKFGVWDWDLARDEIWATDGCRRLLGLAAEERFDIARFLACLHPDDRPGADAAVRGAIAGGAAYDHEFRVVLPDGRVRWIAGRGQVERDAHGRPLRMLGATLDIDERKRMEGDVARHRGELAHLARVSSLGELSGSIAHELNQPLAAILSNAQAAICFLDDPRSNPAEVREILVDIARQDKRAGEIIRRMRALLRKEVPQRVEVDLRHIVDEVLALMRSDLIARNLACTVAPGGGPAVVLGDRIQLQQVLINLIANAADAMEAQPRDRRRLTIAVAGADGRVRCEVGDQGPGIPIEERERVFEAFVSGKPHGIGIGLAICRDIIGGHGGTLVADGNPEGGAILRVELPAHQPPA